MEHTKFKEILKNKLDTSQKHNSKYSLRAFSRDLNISPSALSEIINGKRRVADKTMKAILKQIGEDKSFIDQKKRPIKRRKILNQEFILIKHWYYFAIQSLADTEGFKLCSRWIALRLNISVARSKRALEELLKHNLILKNPDGSFNSSDEQIFAESPIPSKIIQSNHKQSLELARYSLEKDCLELRDFSSMTIAIDPNDIPIVKEKIKRFRRNLNSFLENGKKKEVYRLNIQFFPLSTPLEDGEIQKSKKDLK